MKMRMQIPEVLLEKSIAVNVRVRELVDGLHAIVVDIRYQDGSEIVGVLTTWDEWEDAIWASVSTQDKQAVRNGRSYKRWLNDRI